MEVENLEVDAMVPGWLEVGTKEGVGCLRQDYYFGFVLGEVESMEDYTQAKH